MTELLRIHPAEHPVSIQLFGHDPEVMRSGAAIAAEAGADLIDINMGCPVRKVRKVGAGAELLRRPDLALALARAAVEGSRAAGHGEAALRDRARRPVRSRPRRSSGRGGRRRGDRASTREAPRCGTRATPTTRWYVSSSSGSTARRPGDRLRRARDGAAARAAPIEESGADAVMIARGALGNPWIFEELTGRRVAAPSDDEIVDELLWTMERAEEHLGEPARRSLRAQVLPLVPGAPGRAGGAEADALQRTESLEEARVLVTGLVTQPRARRSGRLSRSKPPRYNRPPARPASALTAPRSGVCSSEPGARSDASLMNKQEMRFSTVARESLITQEGLEKLRTELAI